MIHTCQGDKSSNDRATVYDTFGKIYSRTVEYGHVTDDYFVELGYPQDRDVNGKIVERLSDADHLQRAKILNHTYQRECRENRKRAALEKARQKQAKARLALLLIKRKNQECEKILLDLLGNPNPDGEGVLFSNITLDHLEKRKCTVPLLQAFIHARSWSGEKPRGAVNWPKKKGKASDGETANSFVAMAYRCRNQEVRLKIPEAVYVPDNEMDVDEDTAMVPAATIEIMGSDPSASVKKPSDFLSEDSWVKATKESFAGTFKDVDDAMKQRADELLIRLQVNMKSHIEKKRWNTARCGTLH